MAAFIFVMNFVMILDKCCTYSVYRLYIYGFEPRLSLYRKRAINLINSLWLFLME